MLIFYNCQIGFPAKKVDILDELDFLTVKVGTIIKAKSISGATVADEPAIEKSRNLNNDIPAVIFPCIRIPARNM